MRNHKIRGSGDENAFLVHLGMYEFLKLTFGMKTASNTFQQCLNTVFADYLRK